MLKTLKRKFVLINMALVFAVMTAVLAAGLTANYIQFKNEFQAALQRELSLDIKASHPLRPHGYQRLPEPNILYIQRGGCCIGRPGQDIQDQSAAGTAALR